MNEHEKQLLSEIRAGIAQCEKMLGEIKAVLDQREREYQIEIKHCRDSLNLKPTNWANEIKATAMSMNQLIASQLPPR